MPHRVQPLMKVASGNHCSMANLSVTTIRKFLADLFFQTLCLYLILSSIDVGLALLDNGLKVSLNTTTERFL